MRNLNFAGGQCPPKLRRGFSPAVYEVFSLSPIKTAFFRFGCTKTKKFLKKFYPSGERARKSGQSFTLYLHMMRFFALGKVKENVDTARIMC